MKKVFLLTIMFIFMMMPSALTAMLSTDVFIKILI